MARGGAGEGHTSVDGMLLANSLGLSIAAMVVSNLVGVEL
jgi:hypothetical protein